MDAQSRLNPRLASHLTWISKQKRRRQLADLPGLHLADLVLKYSLMLNDEQDPVELILDFEFERSRTPLN